MVVKATIDIVKHHPSLIPLFIAVGGGVVASVLYPLRVAIKSPDVVWNRKTNPEPWNLYATDSYKFIRSDHAIPWKPTEIPSY